METESSSYAIIGLALYSFWNLVMAELIADCVFSLIVEIESVELVAFSTNTS